MHNWQDREQWNAKTFQKLVALMNLLKIKAMTARFLLKISWNGEYDQGVE